MPILDDFCHGLLWQINVQVPDDARSRPVHGALIVKHHRPASRAGIRATLAQSASCWPSAIAVRK